MVTCYAWTRAGDLAVAGTGLIGVALAGEVALAALSALALAVAVTTFHRPELGAALVAVLLPAAAHIDALGVQASPSKQRSAAVQPATACGLAQTGERVWSLSTGCSSSSSAASG